MTDNKIILLAFGVVILNGLIGHFFAPYGLFLTPIVLITTASLVIFQTQEVRVIIKSILIYLLVALNDILIKLYSGGMHDEVGLAWTQMMMYLGLFPTFVILLISVFSQKNNSSVLERIIAITLYVIFISIHLQLFDKLGLGRYY